MKKKCLPIMCLALLACGCSHGPDLSSFTEEDAVRVEIDGSTEYIYNPKTCQMSFNRENCEFTSGTDTMSDYFIVKLSELPEELGAEVLADVSWTTSTDVMSRKNITLRLVDKQGDKLWLWDSHYRIGVEIRTLE